MKKKFKHFKFKYYENSKLKIHFENNSKNKNNFSNCSLELNFLNKIQKYSYK